MESEATAHNGSVCTFVLSLTGAYTPLGAEQMSKDLEELKKELQSLIEQGKIEAEAVRRAQVRAGGRRPDSASNRSFAASLAGDLEKHDKERDQRIAEIQAEIKKIEGGGQKS
jgi:hypothetical protein